MSTADLLLINARVLTQNPAQPLAEAVAVCGERIVAVGSFDELRGLAGPYTAMVDAQGGTAVPGFHDAHLHLLSYARQNARVDCRGTVSLDELVERIAARVSHTPPGGWIRPGSPRAESFTARNYCAGVLAGLHSPRSHEMCSRHARRWPRMD
jgi:predicted amidohydrolase YtcJ